MNKTGIEWTDMVWNPVTGCSRGCSYCYARRMANRLKGRYGYDKDDPFRVTIHIDRLNEPMGLKKPKRIFVSSMGDLFDKDVPLSDIGRILTLARALPIHTFLFLTKQPERMRQALLAFDMTGECNGRPCNHLWFGVSIEDQKTADERIPILLKTPAAHRWVSIEPYIDGPISLEGFFWNYYPHVHLLKEISWVVIGGLSLPGGKVQAPKKEWVDSLVEQCDAAGCPLFVKPNAQYPVERRDIP